MFVPKNYSSKFTFTLKSLAKKGIPKRFLDTSLLDQPFSYILYYMYIYIYIYIYYIYIYILYLFYTLWISDKKGSKLGYNQTIFGTLWAHTPTKLQFRTIYLHRYVTNQEANKTIPTIFFFSNIFWIISVNCFHTKICFQNSSNYWNKKWVTHC